MEKAKWKKKIVKACKDAGTYRPFFDSVIDSLSGIMENRDIAHEQYVASGSKPTVIHTNKAKEKNIAKNPALVMEMELNSQALSYWRDLGLTPAGFKKIKQDMKEEQASFDKILEELVNEE